MNKEMEALLNERYTPLQRKLVAFVDETQRAMEALSASDVQLHAMAVLYMAVDALAACAAEEEIPGRTAFIRWVDTYLIPASTAGDLTPFKNGLDEARGVDLYAARCGLLHANTADADLVANGKARRVFYAGSGQIADDLRKYYRRSGVDACVVIMNELAHAFLIGAHRFIDRVGVDPAMERRVRSRSALWFTYEGPPRRGIETAHED